MNRYFQEVLDAHELIRRWLGEAATSSQVGEALLNRFSPAYSMVTTGGMRLDYAALEAFFRSQRGAKPGLQIGIENMQIVAESEHGATVTYQEWQQLPGQKATQRFSTVVFERDGEGNPIWRYLHETAALQP